MSFFSAANLNGSWMWRIAVAGLVVAGGATGGAQPTPFAVPEAVMKGLGWKDLSPANYRGEDAFFVESEPAQWPEALKQATAWAASGPKFAEQPAEYLLRKMARIEALALNLNQPGVRDELRAEAGGLADAVQTLRGRTSSDASGRVVEQLAQLQKALGTWLAETPADRIAVLRAEMARYRPRGREELAARYGGEARLAELVALGKELNRLSAAFEAAQADRTTPEPARAEAVRKAGGELGYFYGFNGSDREWQRAINTPDLRTEIDGGVGNEDDSRRYLTIPDMLLWVNEAEAGALLAEAYALPVEVVLEEGTRTGALARRLIIAGTIKPKRMPWRVLGWRGRELNAESAGEMAALHDVLKKQFPDLTAKRKEENDWSQRNTLAAWPVALAVAGREDEAVELYRKANLNGLVMPYQLQATDEVTAAVWALALRIAGKAPTPAGWGVLTAVARETKRGGELGAFAAKQVAAAPAGSEQARLWQARQAWVLIGEDNVDEGLALLTPLLEVRPGANEKLWAAEWTRSLTRLLNLAAVLPRPELAAAWREKLAVDFKTPTGLVWSAGTALFDAYAALEVKAGNFKAVEAVLRARLATGSEVNVDRSLAWLQLADMLVRQGRHAGALGLVAESPYFNMRSMIGMTGAGPEHPARAWWRPQALSLAEALAGTGRKDEAAVLLENYLMVRTGYDPAYALYTKVLGEEAAPFLEKLWGTDRREERPLIWLATVQLAAGKTAEAGVTIKRAIAIDPSDGEQPRGDRMRAYAVWREIELKLGNAKQAEACAALLTEIRRAEAVDELVSAGLTDRAIKELKAAVETEFPEGYYLRVRLASFLRRKDRMAEATEHFRRSVELLPDGIGRAGNRFALYELTFEGADRQAAAEQVLSEQAARPGVKPQVYYLLGYLRQEQKRWDESADYGFKAAAAEPEYLSTWRNLALVLPNSTRPREDQDRVALRLVELDPTNKRIYSPGGWVRDLPALWRVYAETTREVSVVLAKRFEIDAKTGFILGTDDKSPGRLDYRPNTHRVRTTANQMARHEVLWPTVRVCDAVYRWKQNPE